MLNPVIGVKQIMAEICREDNQTMDLLQDLLLLVNIRCKDLVTRQCHMDMAATQALGQICTTSTLEAPIQHRSAEFFRINISTLNQC